MDFKATDRTIIRLQQQRPYKTCTPTNGQLGGHPFKLVALAHHKLVWERYLIVSGDTSAVRACRSTAMKHLQPYLSMDGNIQEIIIDAWQNSTSDGMFYLFETKKSWVKKATEGIAMGSIEEAN